MIKLYGTFRSWIVQLTVWLQYSCRESLRWYAHKRAIQPRADSSDSDDDADVVDLTNEGPVTLPASSASTPSASAASPPPHDLLFLRLVQGD